MTASMRTFFLTLFALIGPATAFSPAARKAAELRWHSPTKQAARTEIPPTLPSLFGAAAGATAAALAGSVLVSPPPEVDVLALSSTAAVVILPLSIGLAYQGYSAREAELAMSTRAEACVLESEHEAVCGEVSFDSAGEMVCVETYDEDGRLRWACA